MASKSNKIRSVKVTLYLVIAFAMYYAINELFFHEVQANLRAIIANRITAFVVAYLLVGVPLFVATWLINRRWNVLRDLGFMSNPLIGIAFAVICTSPMFAGYAYMAGGLASGLSITVLITGSLLAGVFEETYFRGFLFGQLFRTTRLGFLPSIILCSAIFASAHLYQSTDPEVLLGILVTTFLGSVLFAWLYVEWGYNIWIPIFLHSLMNASWYIFAAGSNAFGGLGANVFRLVTVVFAITITVLYKRHTKQRVAINRTTLWRQRTSGEHIDELEN